MVSTELIEQAQRLREAGQSVKRIARALGVPPAVAADLVNSGVDNQRDDALIGCWISPGWSQGLSLDTPSKWPDSEPGAGGADGLASVLLARRADGARVRVSGCLLDLYCLGVKNVLGPNLIDVDDFAEFKEQYFSAHSSAPLEFPLELAQQLVHGAVAYARTLGFRPAGGFRAVADELGVPATPGGVGFGRDGKPMYVQGPRDDAKAVLRTLDRSVGPGGYECVVID
jgi:hypothetical protein